MTELPVTNMEVTDNTGEILMATMKYDLTNRQQKPKLLDHLEQWIVIIMFHILYD